MMGSPQCTGRALMVFGFLELLAGGALVAAGIRQVFNQSRYYIYYHGIWAGAIICLAGVFAVCGGGNVSRKGYSTAHLIFAIIAALGAAPALITLSFFEAKSDSVGYYWSDPEYCYYKCSPQQYLKENINAIVQNAFDSSGDPYLNFFQRGKRQLVAMGAPMGLMDGFYNTTTTVPASMGPAVLQTAAPAVIMAMPEAVQPNYAYAVPDYLMQYYSGYNQTTTIPDMSIVKMTMGLAPYPLPAIYPYPINQSGTTTFPNAIYPLPPIYSYPINQSGTVNYSSAAYPNVYYPNVIPEYLKQYYSGYNQTTTIPDMSLPQMTVGLAPYPLPAIYPYPINQSATATSFFNPIYPGAMNYSSSGYPAVGLAYPLPAIYPYEMSNQSAGATSLPMPLYPSDIYNYSTPPYAYAINPVIGMSAYLYPYYAGLYNQTTPAGYYDWTPNIMPDYFPMPNDTMTPSWPVPYPGLYPNDTLAAISWNMTNPNFNITDPAVMMKLMQGMLNAGITPDDWNGTDPTMMPMIMMMMNAMLSASNSTVAPTTTTEVTSTTTIEAALTNGSPTRSSTVNMPTTTTRTRTTTRPRTTTTKKPTITTRRRTSLSSTTINSRMQTSDSRSSPVMPIETTTAGIETQPASSSMAATTEATTSEAPSTTTTPPDTSTSTIAPTEAPSMPPTPATDTAAPRKIIPMQLAASTTPQRIQTPKVDVPTRVSSGSTTPARTTTSARKQSTSPRLTPGTTRQPVPTTTMLSPKKTTTTAQKISSTPKRSTSPPLCGPLGCTTTKPSSAAQQNPSTKAQSPAVTNNAAITSKPRSGADAKTNVFKCRYNPCPNWPAWKIEMGEIIVGAGMILFFLISAALAIALISTTPKSAVYPVSNGMWYMAADTQPVFIPSPYGEYSSTAAVVSIQPPRIATV